MSRTNNNPNGSHKARKRFGQNFLVDIGVINDIVRAIAPKQDDNIVEIGPGQGAITSLLLDACPQLNVVELDRDLIPILLAQFANYSGFKIHQTDALKFDFTSLASTDNPLRVVGNLPYNISTPLIFHLLEQREVISDMHFMLQKEVVLRLAAGPNDKNYGRLSVMTQYFCAIENLFEVGPNSFKPAPKVDSAIVRLTPHKTLPFIAKQPIKFEHLVKTAFAQRRKTLRNNLKNLSEDISLDQLDIDLSRRAETVSVQEYVNLSNTLWS